ncbi:MAG TPA: hypothetical protein PLI09_08920 [Candidatus Hydrogenedentes bacterium]|nr:hypothetical protein [Candidatus Hydrogenedentota bacterium]
MNTNKWGQQPFIFYFRLFLSQWRVPLKINGYCPYLFLVLVLGAAPVWACNSGTVRDAAFEGKRDTHRLCVMGNKGDAEADAIFARLNTWFQTNKEGFNLRVERVNADDPEIRWERYGLPSAPPSFPVTVLVGVSLFLQQAFVIEHWEPAPEDAALAALRTSPSLDAAKQHLVDVWAVVLYARGTGDNAGKGKPVLEEIVKQWTAEHAPGIRLVLLDRADPREKILCSFAGIKPEGPDWAGIMFGRGRLMGPPLQGADITEENVNRLLNNLTVPCTCLQESIALGIDVPLVWEPRLDQKFASLEAAAGHGYKEISFAAQAETLAEEVPNKEGNNLLLVTLVPLIVIGVLSLAAVGFMILRRRNLRMREGR